MSNSSRNLLRKAFFYLDLGWSFYPTRPLSKMPFASLLPVRTDAEGNTIFDEQGRPKRTWTPFQSEQPDRFDVEMWFKQQPDANLALITGPVSNLVIIDLDTAQAVLDFLELCDAQSIYDFGTPVVQSRRGWHLYFERPDTERCSGDLGLADCDVKADGGCCTAPPSVHQSGHEYRFELSPAKYALQPLPAPVVERLEQNRKPAPIVGNFAFFPDKNLSGYGRKALLETVHEITACTSNRNDFLNAKAYSIGRIIAAGALDYQTAHAALFGAGVACGLTPSEVQATLISGLSDGMTVPRHIEPSRKSTQPKRQPTLTELRAQRAYA
jgi:hypothetical protein